VPQSSRVSVTSGLDCAATGALEKAAAQASSVQAVSLLSIVFSYRFK
jgi:hypothetical protein